MNTFIFLSFLTPYWLYKLGPLSMIIVGLLVEKEFISRPTLFANTMALNVYLAIVGTTLWYFAWYSNIGLIFGFIAIISYAQKESLPSLFYNIGFVYNSLIVGVIIFFL